MQKIEIEFMLQKLANKYKVKQLTAKEFCTQWNLYWAMLPRPTVDNKGQQEYNNSYVRPIFISQRSCQQVKPELQNCSENVQRR